MTGTLADLLAYAIALVLISGGASKLHDLADFTLAVEAYEIAPERLVRPFAIAFAWAELASGLLLIPGFTRPLGGLLGLVVLLAATLAVIVNLRRGRRMIDCGCGGVSGRQPVSWWLVWRNAGLSAALFTALSIQPIALGLVATVLGALTFVLLYAAADQLLANGLRQTALRRPA